MDGDERKIGMLIAAFDVERAQLQGAIAALNQIGVALKRDVKAATEGAAAGALKSLTPEIHSAEQVLKDLQRFSLWQAALQHVAVAIVAIVVTLLAVWWYVPPLSEITDRRAERDQLEASIAELTKRGAKIDLSTCGDKKRLCVSIDEKAGRFGDPKRGELYMIAKGY
jgi:hypothetical protein